MKKAKAKITNIEEFRSALRIAGYLFPTNLYEFEMSSKLIPQEIDISDIATRIDPEEIWNSPFKRKYSNEISGSYSSNYAMAARGELGIDANILNQLISKHNEQGAKSTEDEGDSESY